MRIRSFAIILFLLSGCTFRPSHSIEAILLNSEARAQIADQYAKEIEKVAGNKSETLEFEDPLTPFGTELIDRLRTKGFSVYVAENSKSTPGVCSYRIDSLGQGVIASSFSSPSLTLSRIYAINANQAIPQGRFTVLRREHE